jgi:hypothetical protein
VLTRLAAAAVLALAACSSSSPAPAPADVAVAVPVVAIHGYYDCAQPNPVETPWAFLAGALPAPLLPVAFYECDEGGHRVGSFTTDDSIDDVAAAVVAWLEDTVGPSRPVDLVGHSMGGLVARVVAASDRVTIRNVVTLSTPHDGFPPGHPFLAACGPAAQCRDMTQGSPFLAALGDPGGEWWAMGSRSCDSVPLASAIAVPDAHPRAFECIGHLDYLLTDEVLAAVLGVLR